MRHPSDTSQVTGCSGRAREHEIVGASIEEFTSTQHDVVSLIGRLFDLCHGDFKSDSARKTTTLSWLFYFGKINNQVLYCCKKSTAWPLPPTV
jgi:hypothetical protein